MRVSQTLAVPAWFWIATGMGPLWNLFGVYQFLSTVGATVEGLMATGQSKPQAQLYSKLPLWMNAAFSVGVFGGA